TLGPPPGSALFPYTTLFRSRERGHGGVGGRAGLRVPGAGKPAGAGALGAGRAQVEVELGVEVAAGDGGQQAAAVDDGELAVGPRSEEHTSELQSRENLVCRL